MMEAAKAIEAQRAETRALSHAKTRLGSRERVPRAIARGFAHSVHCPLRFERLNFSDERVELLH